MGLNAHAINFQQFISGKLLTGVDWKMIPRVVEFNLGLKKRLPIVKKEGKYNGLILMWAFPLYSL